MTHLTKNDYQFAIDFATRMHSGQSDQSGESYISHPIRVARSLDVLGDKIWTKKVVAVLHDTVEDTCVTIEQLEAMFGEEVHDAVDAMTKRKNEPYKDYLDRVGMNPIAIEVKLADMADNSDPKRLLKLPVEKQIRLVAKYTRGRHYLLTGEWYKNEDLDRVIKAGYRK